MFGRLKVIPALREKELGGFKNIVRVGMPVRFLMVFVTA